MIRKRPNAMQDATSPVMPDDLTRIKGIGPAIAAQLKDADILTFAQLAHLTPEDISVRIAGLSPKRITREKWVKQAQRWASKTGPAISLKSEVVRESRQHYATFTMELLLSEDNSVRRTRVTYVQTKLEEIWVGWAERQLLGFITKCARLRIPPSESAIAAEFTLPRESTLAPEVVSSPARAPEVPPANAQLRNVLSGVLQVGDLETMPLDSNMPRHIAYANEGFNVRIPLDLAKVKTPPSTLLNCIVTIWAKKLGTGTRQIIGEQQSTFMPADKIPCVVESRIPSQGTYRLEAMVALTGASTSPSPHSTIRAWQEGSLLQVF